ncbi:ABC transporter permease [Paludifilum halophilum]|uniref:ABC transporter permease n=1 Tax=Paludifilum halophilum TaxID=1642702 RepID=A0A235B4Y7_9BACL|nr:ABC transporter permease [Paludifilum halophilum]
MQKTILYIILAMGVILTVGPFYWMIVGATNPSGETLRIPPRLIPGSYLMENLNHLFASVDIWRSFLNSAFITITYTFLAVLISAAAGYAFAKYQFRGKEILFSAFLISMMIPYQALVIPQFELFSTLGLLDSYSAIILPQLAYPFAIFLMRQNMQSIPDSLIEAARVDGAGEFFIFFRIGIPTMLPAITAVSIFLFTHQWNNFLWPLVALISEEQYTLPVALATLAGQRSIDYGQLMLGASISILPIFILFLFLQRYFIAGIISGAVKE